MVPEDTREEFLMFCGSHGAELWFGNQDAFGTIEHNAAQLKVSAENALRQSGAEKLNLIAHPKGGIEARYLISRLDMAERIASLTTIRRHLIEGLSLWIE